MKCLNRFHTTTKCDVLNGPKLFKSEWARHTSSAHKGKKVGLSPPGPTASPHMHLSTVAALGVIN